MTRIANVPPNQAKDSVKKMFAGIEQKMGKVYNVFKTMGNSPAVLKGFLAMSEAAGETSLSPALREEIALAVGQSNQCSYCLSAHTAIAHNQGLADTRILLARKGQASDPKTAAILQFAKHVVENRGNISDEEISKLRHMGVTEQEIVEVIFVVAMNIFTNYFNHITDPEIDFPQAPSLN